MRNRARAALLLCGLALLAQGCERDDLPRRQVDVAAPLPQAQLHPGFHRVAATGRVEGWREADVTSKLPGRVLRFAFDEGDRVEAGATVVQLEDRDLRVRVQGARVRAREAQRSLERARELREQGVVSASELDRAESEYLTRAAELEEARVILAYASIEAPFTGTLMHRFKEVGESVTSGSGPDPLFRIADLSRLKVVAEVPENDIAAIHMSQRAEIATDAYPEARFSARVRRIGLAVGRKQLHSDDPRERLHEKVVEVELVLAADVRLKSGMTVDIVFPLESNAG